MPKKAATTQVCRTASSLEWLTGQRFVEQVAGGLTHGGIPSVDPSGSWGLHPKTPNNPDGRKCPAKVTTEVQLFQPSSLFLG